jgi:hypothetical protein
MMENPEVIVKFNTEVQKCIQVILNKKAEGWEQVKQQICDHLLIKKNVYVRKCKKEEVEDLLFRLHYSH